MLNSLSLITNGLPEIIPYLMPWRLLDISKHSRSYPGNCQDMARDARLTAIFLRLAPMDSIG